MYKNYFILNRIVLELNSALKGFTVTEIFSQEKDKLILKCGGELEKYIEISVNPGEPYLTLKDEYHRARKNSIDFFGVYLPLKISKFGISDHDRLVKIHFENASLYFAVRGKHSNVFIEGSDGIVNSFKNEDESYLTEFKDEIQSHIFISEKKKIDYAFPDLEFEEYRKKYPFLGREIINEAKFRYSDAGSKNKSVYLQEITDELLEGTPAVFISSNDLSLAVKTFHIFPSDEVQTFDSVVDALNFYLGKKFYLDAFTTKIKTAERFIEKVLSRLSSKLNDLSGRIERGSREEEYNKLGNLLLINLNKVFQKSSSVEIEDIYENNRLIIIKMDPKLTPQRNAEYYFNKAGNEKIAYNKSKDLFRDISINYKNMIALKERFEKTETMEEINKIMTELHIKSGEKSNSPDDIKSKFKHYVIENKYDVYVGKDSANNDLLTMKFAKQNDYWFHARSVPGSHVILRVLNNKEPVPKNVIKSAASIAAFHSKAKTSGLAPVSYTFKKYVTKKKGMEPGKVALLKEDVLLVKPGIPANCEYVSGE